MRRQLKSSPANMPSPLATFPPPSFSPKPSLKSRLESSLSPKSSSPRTADKLQASSPSLAPSLLPLAPAQSSLSTPILTGGAPQLAFTAVEQFIVPGSCQNINIIGLTPFPSLTVETTPEATNSTQLFSVHGKVSSSDVSLACIAGQNLPVTVPISGVNYDAVSGKSYFFAPFLYDPGFARGLTIGALVRGIGTNFNSTLAVAAATLDGPALIEVD